MANSTPIIRRIAEQNGSFYTFSSATREMSLNVGEATTTKQFRFSKFALLNLPDFNERGVNRNTIKFYASQSGARKPLNVDTTSSTKQFAESFQNYCLNFESQVLSSQTYDLGIDSTVSERIFFKWLKELTAIRFEPAKDNNGVIIDGYYSEEKNSANYKRVVEYIGTLGVTNAFESKDNNYTEVYAHVPVAHGGTKTPLFKVSSDNNYSPGQIFYRTDRDRELISGRTITDPLHPDGLRVDAIYDSTFKGATDDDIPGFAVLSLYKKIQPGLHGPEPITINGDLNTDYFTTTSPNNWWFNTSAAEAYAYLTEPSSFETATNDYFAIFSDRNSGFGTDINDPLSGAVRFVRSKLDGITLEKTINPYNNIVPGVTSFSELNSQKNTDSFEFNAVLLYYDIYSNNPSTGLETVHATNLFGVYFIDRPTQPNANSVSWIPRLKKNRPNALSRQNGDAFSFKFNLKISNQSAPTDLRVIDPFLFPNVEVEVDNGYTFSMDLFADAMNQMKLLAQSIIDGGASQSLDRDKVNLLSSLVNKLNMPLDDLVNRITKIERIVSSNEFVLSADNSTQIGKLIVKLSDDLKKILKGEIPTNLSFDLAAFEEGLGIKIERQPGSKKAVFSTTFNSYNLSDKVEAAFPLDWNNSGNFYNYTFKLEEFSNYYRISSISTNSYTSNVNLQSSYPKKDFRIFIDDTDVKWTRGQSFRIFFKDELLFLNPIISTETQEASIGSNITIFTDARNRLRNPSPYGAKIATLTAADFTPGLLSKRYVDIICDNPDTFDFFIDIPN